MGLGASAVRSRKPVVGEDVRSQPSFSLTTAEVFVEPAKTTSSTDATAANANEYEESTDAQQAKQTMQPEVDNIAHQTSMQGLEDDNTHQDKGDDEVAARAEVSQKKGKQCPEHTSKLVSAIETENWEAAEHLLREQDNLDISARTSDWGYSLLRAAAEEGRLELCHLLLDRRADVNSRDQNNMTPLMGTIVGGDYAQIVTLLLQARADATAQTDDGFTALSWATRLNRSETIKLLRQAGLTGASTCF